MNVSNQAARRWYTVVGFHTDAESDSEFPFDPEGYQRFAHHVRAKDPKQAETLVRRRCRDLIVAGVLEGRLRAVR